MKTNSASKINYVDVDEVEYIDFDERGSNSISHNDLSFELSK